MLRHSPPPPLRQTVYSLAVQSDLAARLTQTQRLALLVAALCHDLEHPVPPRAPCLRAARARHLTARSNDWFGHGQMTGSTTVN